MFVPKDIPIARDSSCEEVVMSGSDSHDLIFFRSDSPQLLGRVIIDIGAGISVKYKGEKSQDDADNSTRWKPLLVCKQSFGGVFREQLTKIDDRKYEQMFFCSGVRWYVQKDSAVSAKKRW
jgi:hypothetical protein